MGDKEIATKSSMTSFDNVVGTLREEVTRANEFSVALRDKLRKLDRFELDCEMEKSASAPNPSDDGTLIGKLYLIIGDLSYTNRRNYEMFNVLDKMI